MVNTNVFCTSEAHNHGIYDIFAAGSKNHGIYNVFWPAPSKNTSIYIRSFHHVARCSFYMRKG